MGMLDGKVALVTGAGTGIGKGIALLFAAEGAKVLIAARREEKLLETVAQAPDSISHVIMDLCDKDQRERALATAVERHGKLDVLVTNAGAQYYGPFMEMSDEDIAEIYATNLTAMTLLIKSAVPLLSASKGNIVNISSTAGRRASAFVSSYTASKHALNAMTEALRREVGALGIRVCVIEPGATVSEVYDSLPDPAQRDFMREHVTKAGAMAAEDVAAAILFTVGLPRRANVTEILIQPTTDVVAR